MTPKSHISSDVTKTRHFFYTYMAMGVAAAAASLFRLRTFRRRFAGTSACSHDSRSGSVTGSSGVIVVVSALIRDGSFLTVVVGDVADGRHDDVRFDGLLGDVGGGCRDRVFFVRVDFTFVAVVGGSLKLFLEMTIQ